MEKVKFFGIGGQGAVTAAKVLSKAVSLYQDEYAITVPAYGHERRGAPVYAHIIVDKEPVLLNCYVYKPDYILIMDDSIIDKNIGVTDGCSDNTVLILNTGSADTVERYKNLFNFREIYVCDGTGIAEKIMNLNIPNSAMLGALAKTGLVGIDAIEKAVFESFGKVGEINVKTAREAYENTWKA